MTFFLLALLIVPNLIGEKLIKTEVVSGITMLVPADFRPMTDDEMASKYFTTKKPMVLYTNMEVTVDLGINKAITTWKAEDLEIMMSFQKSNIYNLYDDINMLSEGLKEVNGRQYAYFEFVSLVRANQNSMVKKSGVGKYTFIQYLILGENSLVFNFTCPARLREKWQPSARQIMDSIVIKKFGK